jgi:hypothetical protein
MSIVAILSVILPIAHRTHFKTTAHRQSRVKAARAVVKQAVFWKAPHIDEIVDPFRRRRDGIVQLRRANLHCRNKSRPTIIRIT